MPEIRIQLIVIILILVSRVLQTLCIRLVVKLTSVAAKGMKNDTNLRVNMPARDTTAPQEMPTGAGSNSRIAGTVGSNNRKPAIVRSNMTSRACYFESITSPA